MGGLTGADETAGLAERGDKQLGPRQVEGCELPSRAGRYLLPWAVRREHDGQTVAVFSHGAAMRIVWVRFRGCWRSSGSRPRRPHAVS